MAEAIASLISDSEAVVVATCHAVIFAPGRRNRRRFPEGCVEPCESEAQARAKAKPEQDYYAAVASGPSRSSEGFRLYYLVRWLD